MAIKRPAVIVMLALILGEFLAVIGGHPCMFLLCVPLLLMQKITTKRMDVFWVVIFLSAFFGFCVTRQEIESSKRAYRMKEETICLSGNYVKCEKTTYGYRYYLKEVELFGDEMKCGQNMVSLRKILVYTEKEPIFLPGNKVRLMGKLSQFHVAGNYGEFDIRNYYRSLGIYLCVEQESAKVLDEGHSVFRGRMQELQKILKDMFDDICNNKNQGIFKVCDSNKSGIYGAVILGEKSELDGEVKNLYQLNGIAHILAISGLHISSIGTVIYKILRKRYKFVFSASGSMLVVLGFVFMSGTGISSIRAAGMFIFYLFSQMLGRKYDMLSAISFVVILLCMDNPFVLTNVSFQMSFGAILGILFINPILSDFLGVSDKKMAQKKEIKKKKYKEEKFWLITKNIMVRIEQSVVMSMSIHCTILPVLAFNYFEISIYGIVLNVIVIPLMAVVLGCGILSVTFLCGCSMIGRAFIGHELFMTGIINISKAMIMPGCIVLEIYESLCNIFLNFPGNIYVTGKPVPIQIAFYYFLLSVLLLGLKYAVSRRKIRKKEFEENIPETGRILVVENRKIIMKRYAVKIMAWSIIFGGSGILNQTISYHNNGKLQVMFHDVGQGDAILIRKNNFVITIDGGSSDVKNLMDYRLKPIMKARRVRTINYAVITHTDTDHISGLVEILKDDSADKIVIENLLIPVAIIKDDGFQTLMEAADNGITKITYTGCGDYIKKNGVAIRCMHPSKDFKAEERNGYSTVLNIRYEKFQILLTGDISEKEEEYVLKNIEKESQAEKYHCAVLKVPHHGSKYSTTEAFLEKIKPQISVISCGKGNSYGHPHKELLERLKNVQSKVLRTDLSGQIVVETDGETMKVQSGK